ncbi:hypothetical protein BCR37DRAFT_385575 [Protomyces lactucae-debilis]|uniref:Histone-lysine N-methyltransferase, H3 lysine-36 specific n=1 Tax=Protomyces lactucae-debilis TaxID=2754530 RepID=A0A1Y2FQ23_PROLT|nr:uncharacterized protein BCR37DRAFT_385575 [Protomyces lactucae-debilis]ORY86078.1 hypothetical protein BCR37DRAFT_385575 [Protomyces lactucae-debilis]
MAVQLSPSSGSPAATDPSKCESLPASRHLTPSLKSEVVQGFTGTHDKQLEDDALGLEKRIKRVRVKPEETTAEPQLWLDAPSARDAAASEFLELSHCIYQSKDMGESGQEEIMSCDCKPEFDGDYNGACGSESNCINRITSIECLDDECNCGEGCQNQRFQRRQYADVDVIDAGPKGYGLRAMQDLLRGSFVYEYVGEVIGERKFRQRQKDYKDQDEKHFYFMMLQKGEYIDATKKGGYGRFINHSCRPNCYVDKWVVGSKMRMGIFCKRDIIIGEELTFDYNVDRYGGEATPCYCGEPNCLGYIGGKTQTEAANKLPQNVAEALGIDTDDAEDAPRRARRKKEDDDEDYVNTLTPRNVVESDVPKIMATLVLPTERWLLKKLLERILSAEDDRIHSSIIRLHGYQTLGSKLEKHHADSEIATLILRVLHTWPRVTRNKISSSKIEQHVKGIATSESTLEPVRELATDLLQLWGELKMAYRIPRRLGSSAANLAPQDMQLGSPSSSSPSEPSPGPAAPLRLQRARHTGIRRQGPPRPSTAEDAQRTQPSRPPTVSVPAQDEIQAIIDAARKLQQEQADLALAKEADEQLRLETEARQRAERARKHQLRKAQKAQKASERARDLNDDPKVRSKRDISQLNSNGSTARAFAEGTAMHPSRTQDQLNKDLEKSFARVVPNFVSKYQATLGKDEVKKRAREIVKILVAKEIARPKPSVDAFSEEKLVKIKTYCKEFMRKLISRTSSKSTSDGLQRDASTNEDAESTHKRQVSQDNSERLGHVKKGRHE